MSLPYKYAIIGFGISGQLLVLELLKANISPKNIIICDPTFLGGDLALKYGSVMSNTPWWKTKKALENYATATDLPEIPIDQCTPVRVIANACLQVALKASSYVEKITTYVLSLEQTESEWAIKHSFGSFKARTVFLTIGGTENQLDISIPQIPLSIAMDKEQLKNYISSDTIAVFGTSHSGTIVLDNLQALSTPSYGIYKHTTPFQFESETYNGLKEGSSTIANAILNNKYPNITLVSWNNPLVIHKALQRTTKAIVATGFKSKVLDPKYVDYNPETAALNFPGLYGFGLAYPGVTTIDKRNYQDNSVLTYQFQIQKCLPNILKEYIDE